MRSSIILLVIALILIATALPEHADARNTSYQLKIADVKADPRYAQNVPDDVAFYFADQPHPTVEKDLGEFVTNRKSNSTFKSDEEACLWTMISALKQLRERAVQEGGNAVINIVSYYRKQAFSSQTLYECHAGAIVSAVALKGTVVRLKP
jgi:hypothetical protein